MKLRRSLTVAAAVLCWWPIPPVGYLLLRKWSRAVVFVILVAFGPMLLVPAFGQSVRAPYAAVMWAGLTVDTLRLAVLDWRATPRAGSPEPP